MTVNRLQWLDNLWLKKGFTAAAKWWAGQIMAGKFERQDKLSVNKVVCGYNAVVAFVVTRIQMIFEKIFQSLRILNASRNEKFSSDVKCWIDKGGSTSFFLFV